MTKYADTTIMTYTEKTDYYLHATIGAALKEL